MFSFGLTNWSNTKYYLSYNPFYSESHLLWSCHIYIFLQNLCLALCMRCYLSIFTLIFLLLNISHTGFHWLFYHCSFLCLHKSVLWEKETTSVLELPPFLIPVLIELITLFLGDTVIFKTGMATVIIEANDDPNGIFSLEPLEKPVEEGKSNNFL